MSNYNAEAQLGTATGTPASQKSESWYGGSSLASFSDTLCTVRSHSILVRLFDPSLAHNWWVPVVFEACSDGDGHPGRTQKNTLTLNTAKPGCELAEERKGKRI